MATLSYPMNDCDVVECQ